MVAGIKDLDQREAFSDLMQAVSDGKFRKPNGNSIFINSTRIWRQIMKAFNPELENNIQIIREGSAGGSYDDFIERLEHEGSSIRNWLDKNNRENIRVLDFCKKIGVDNQPHDLIQKFLNSLAPKISDDCIILAAKNKFSKSKKKNFDVVSVFLSKSLASSFDFVYADMRFFQSMHSQIISWIRSQNVRHIYLRDNNPNYATLDTPSNLNSVYQKRHLATTTLIDIQFTCGHPLRTSYLHILSGSKVTPLDHQAFDIMLFKELFEHYFYDKKGVCFVGSADTSIHKKYVGQTNYRFVFEDEFKNGGGHVSDGSQKTRDSLEFC